MKLYKRGGSEARWDGGRDEAVRGVEDELRTKARQKGGKIEKLSKEDRGNYRKKIIYQRQLITLHRHTQVQIPKLCGVWASYGLEYRVPSCLPSFLLLSLRNTRLGTLEEGQVIQTLLPDVK